MSALNQLELLNRADAVLSPDRVYRYRLERLWDTHAPVLNFVMLNPSTATAIKDDPTVRRCDGFARAWGFGSFVVTNLFAFRATDPDDLCGLPAEIAIGPENDEHIIRAAESAARIVVAWGEHGALHRRADQVLALLRSKLPDRQLHCFRRNVSGQPAHPLYQPNAAVPVPFEVGS